jgi:thiamine-phosphate pyrophosphorylase
MPVFGRDLRPFLYAIIDTSLCARKGLDAHGVAEACLAGGAPAVQVRDKSGASGSFLTLARRIVATASGREAAVIVNDRADIARLSGAAGVHVGQEDLLVHDVREIVGDGMVVGLSTHSEEQVDAALATDATYLAVGPIFGTLTKDTGYTARGLDLVRYAAGRGKPVVAIGGITLAEAPLVVSAGATGVAVISDLLTGGNPESRTRQFVAVLTGASPDSR